MDKWPEFGVYDDATVIVSFWGIIFKVNDVGRLYYGFKDSLSM